MNPRLEQLIHLGEIDTKIDSYKPKIEAIEATRNKIEAKAEAKAKERDQIAHEIRDAKETIVSFEEQIKLLSEQVNENAKKAKLITTEKEMKALQVEEEIIKEKLQFANDEIARLNELIEKKEALLAEKEEELKALEKEIKTVQEETSSELEAIEKEKASLFNEREKLSRDIDQKVLVFYEKIRAWAGNTAVVQVKKQACYGCVLELSDKIYADVIKGEDITTCSHCGRILYYKPQEA